MKLNYRSEQPSADELEAREDAQLQQEAFEYAVQGMSPEELYSAAAGDISGPTKEAIVKRLIDLHTDNHLEALVWAGIYTKTVEPDGEEWYQVAGDTMPDKEVVDRAVADYRRWQYG